jgi:hypothetical protein
MIKKAKRIPSIQTQAINPNKIQKKPRQKLMKISSYVNKKQQTHKTSHSSAKQMGSSQYFYDTFAYGTYVYQKYFNALLIYEIYIYAPYFYKTLLKY